jgi:hypothetical protein
MNQKTNGNKVFPRPTAIHGSTLVINRSQDIDKIERARLIREENKRFKKVIVKNKIKQTQGRTSKFNNI